MMLQSSLDPIFRLVAAFFPAALMPGAIVLIAFIPL